MPRIVLLGASNVTLSFPRLWCGLRRMFDRPLEMFAAHGHGRSFGQWSRVGPRALPGILNCRLWDDLSARPDADEPTRVLITDIGNDLLYGVEPDQIGDWVATCLERLHSSNSRIVLTQLPIASILSLGRSRFHLFRCVLFPSSQFSFEEIESKVMRLNQRIVELGQRFGLPTPELRRAWYGVDPIHIRRRHRAAAWKEILSPWFDESSSAGFGREGFMSSWQLWRKRPRERRWFGCGQQVAQPVVQEPDGSSLWLY